jgi:hypothetical protein
MRFHQAAFPPSWTWSSAFVRWQGTGGIVELAHALAMQGGGISLFTGCAGGDAGAALLIRFH